MRVTVVGAGAIGAYVGAALSRAGTDVTLVARRAHGKAMRENGVRVLSPLGDFVAHPVVTEDLEAVAGADVVFVSLKANSLPELAPRLGPLLDPGSTTVWAQNGIPWWYFHACPGPFEGLTLDSVDPGGVIAGSLSPASAVGCVIYPSTDVVEPGVIRHVEGTRFPIGEPDGSRSDRCRQISEAFAAAGLKAPVEARLREHIWLKLVGNAAFNPVSALTGATAGELGSRPEMVAVLRAVMTECASVAEHLGIRLRISLDRRLEAGFAVGDHKTSMLQDLEAGKPLELDCMTGAVIELADRLGLEVPHTRTVHACAKLLDQVRG